MVVAATAAHVFQSRDGGRRFTRVTSLRGAAVRLLSRGANEVFVASTQGVSKSTDRGASFAGWARNLPPESLPISDFHVQADAFLLRHSSGFLRSSTGDNWQPVALPTDSPCGQFPVTHSVVADFRLPAAVPETSGQCIRGSLSKAKAALVSKPGEMILNGVVVPCREGFFCPETCDETNQVVLPCPAGTWCESGVDRQPSLGSHPCPRGHYCPEATDAPVKCPAGTYNHELHQATADACRPAPAGYSIDTQGAAEPLQLCPAGNFCPEGTSDGGTVCPPGTSRRLPGGAAESDCFPCPAGYFCPNDSSTGTSLDPKPCPEGHYCPLGSAAAAQCPAGTLSSSRSVSSAEECDLCPRGSYCTEPGALAVTGACDAGFLCIAGATDPRPTDGVTGSPCPAGGYCVAGTVIVKPCPPGTYNPDEGAENEDACQPCPAGSFCLGSGSSTPDGKCRPGHYCPEQSSSATQRKASIGHFAAAGASEETACEVGYYAPEEGMDKCIACPAGQVCPREGMAAPEECPQGWYCPEAVAAALKCVAGTYGDRPGLREWNECKLCPPGHFCEGEGLLDKSGLCDAGYYCVQSATSARPEVVSTGRSLAGEVSGPCPAGHFCPQGSITPTPCPKGMFSSTLKAVSEATCQQCTEGES
ncbi:GCC2 and GCC3 domain-containing protein, partial [Toxoplasma gondii ARI]